MNAAAQDFIQAVEKAGLHPPAVIPPDKVTRFPGIGKSNGNKSGWAWLSEDGQSGAYGDWATGLDETWHAVHDRTQSAAEREAQKKRIAEAQHIRRDEETKAHAAAAQRAHVIWNQAVPAPATHAYLQRKQVHPYNLRVDSENKLIAPVTINGTLSSLQTIDANGEKLFLSGGAVKGGSHQIGDVTEASTVLLCEGFATSASLHLATGLPVVLAFSANNMLTVAEQLYRQYPTATIMVCGDNDASGTGQREAQKAAEAIGGLVVLPETEGQDFNDVHILCGLDAVEAAIKAVIQRRGTKMITLTRESETECTPVDQWPVLDEAALYGLPGELIKCIAPYSEADSVGILLHLLVASGVMIGAQPHVLVEHMPHCARTNALLVGVTAGGRKGTAYSPVRHVLSQVDESFVSKRVKSGLSSGEGLIYQVRDPQYDQEPIREGGRRSGEIIGYEDRLVDPGEPDKRLLIIESEFSSALTVMEREGNTLSPVLRDVWDHGNLSPLTKKDRMVATGAHVAIIGHITQHELLRKLTATDRANGVANRFLFTLVRQSKFLPSGKGTPPELLQPYFMRFSRTLEGARTRGLMARDQETETLWASVYQKLAEVPQGLTGAILARGAAQVLRLSLMYALLDEAEAQRTDTAIRVQHLLAALAVWDYCKSSAYQIFGDAVGDPIADRFLRLIKTGPQTDTDLYESLGKHEGDRSRKGQALDFLQRLDRIHRASIPTAGRAITEWHVGVLLGCALCARRG